MTYAQNQILSVKMALLTTYGWALIYNVKLVSCWDRRSSGMLCSTDLVFTDVSGQSIGPVFKSPSSWTAWPLMTQPTETAWPFTIGPAHSTEIPAYNYRSTPCNSSEKRRKKPEIKVSCSYPWIYIHSCNTYNLVYVVVRVFCKAL